MCVHISRSALKRSKFLSHSFSSHFDLQPFHMCFLLPFFFVSRESRDGTKRKIETFSCSFSCAPQKMSVLGEILLCSGALEWKALSSHSTAKLSLDFNVLFVFRQHPSLKGWDLPFSTLEQHNDASTRREKVLRARISRFFSAFSSRWKFNEKSFVSKAKLFSMWWLILSCLRKHRNKAGLSYVSPSFLWRQIILSNFFRFIWRRLMKGSECNFVLVRDSVFGKSHEKRTKKNSIPEKTKWN